MNKKTKKTERRKKGDLGENVACKYLEKKGYRLIDRNYWKPWGEIDIVAEKANLISFIEVKTVSREASADISRESFFGGKHGIRPEENLHPAKIQRLYRAIQTYLLDNRVPESKAWQIDLVCVYLDFSSKRAKVELFENVII